ncbi:hypothetical protein RAB80_003821 [Fusarium oxysporum f. sp. vasinfectum]|nr:hypothetical protein RAB80_003821 [Fusarium oxysporum f. sp. vasinfectum]
MTENFKDKQFIRRQLLDANQVQKLALTLNRPNLSGVDIQAQVPPEGTPLPPGYHLVYFTPGGMESELGADGTDTSFNAPFPFTRRMWAGGKIEWAASSSFSSSVGPELRVGDEVEEVTALISATPRKSRSAGEMVLVEVKKEYHGPRELALTDLRSWIFRPEIKPLSGSSDIKLLADADLRQPALVRDQVAGDGSPVRWHRWSPTSLFHFSALTFNGHKIHYNEDWTRNMEGHPGLVVHGPLNLINILNFWQDFHGKGKFPSTINYRALSPLYAGQTYQIQGTKLEAGGHTGKNKWEMVVQRDGILCMKGAIVG